MQDLQSFLVLVVDLLFNPRNLQDRHWCFVDRIQWQERVLFNISLSKRH
jgi:hypothetical protein